MRSTSAGPVHGSRASEMKGTIAKLSWPGQCDPRRPVGLEVDVEWAIWECQC